MMGKQEVPIMQKMKYKVLAADDEYWSRENLRSLISWEDYAIKFLDPACDGEEVLERIKEESRILFSQISTCHFWMAWSF